MIYALMGVAVADNLSANLNSWYTERSGRYARIYRETTDIPGNAQTTWDNNPTVSYAGPQEISYSDNYVYIATEALSTFTMGPWYFNEEQTNLFDNTPGPQGLLIQFPITPTIPTDKIDIQLGYAGLTVDGSYIYGSSDGYSWDNDEDGTGNGEDTGPTTNNGSGDGVWNHNAYYTEGVTFDPSNAHSAGDEFHYHGSPTGMRYLLGDNVTYDESTNTYTHIMDTDEDFNGQHSPIIGWIADGIPLYGPFGYSSPMDATSGVRRMVTGFVFRNGNNGTYNLRDNGRDRLPDWIVEQKGLDTAELTVDEEGPTVRPAYPMGYFVEDYAYKEDVGYTYYDGTGTFDEATHYDLNQYNARYCVTPEFPEGTWAYFVGFDSEGALNYPYILANQYYGDNSIGGKLTTLPSDDGEIVTYFEGGIELAPSVTEVTQTGTEMTLTWSLAEGGTYTLQSSSDLDAWTDVEEVTDVDYAYQDTITMSGSQFYRMQNTATNYVEFSTTFTAAQPLPPVDLITVTIDTVTATVLSYDQDTGATTIEFDQKLLSAGIFNAVLTFTPPVGDAVEINSDDSYDNSGV